MINYIMYRISLLFYIPIVTGIELNLLKYIPNKDEVCDHKYRICTFSEDDLFNIKWSEDDAWSHILKNSFVLSFRVKPANKKGTIFSLMDEGRKKFEVSIDNGIIQIQVAMVTIEHKTNIRVNEWSYFAIKTTSDWLEFYEDCSLKISQSIHRVPFHHNEIRFYIGRDFFEENVFEGEIKDMIVDSNDDVSKYTTTTKCDAKEQRKEKGEEELVDVSVFADSPTSSDTAENNENIKITKNFKKTDDVDDGISDYNRLYNEIVGLKKSMQDGLFQLKVINKVVDVMVNETESESTNITSSVGDIKNIFNSTPSLFLQNPCDSNPCHVLATCILLDESPGYKCSQCPNGSIGDGITCDDENECQYNPCSSFARCTNLEPGYTCSRCADGLKGQEVFGVGEEFALNNKQSCVDENECLEYKTDVCGLHSECFNSFGSYYCSQCAEGYASTLTGQCRKIESCLAPSGVLDTSVCGKNAHCFSFKADLIGDVRKCKCDFGYVGPGHECELDTDFDGSPDKDLSCKSVGCLKDNCVYVPNSDQTDTDGDGLGDACDSDDDNDGYPDTEDNCPTIVNDQKDSDSDGIGDECDNCKDIHNPYQYDTDGDTEGDACDVDIDSDGIWNKNDNCVYVSNREQTDRDLDNIGDACDHCPTTASRDHSDGKSAAIHFEDWVGEQCKFLDSDNDGISDEKDNCPHVPNAPQADSDDDKIGDACDSDDDNDGFDDAIDNCPFVHNLLQFDIDDNRVGDVCEFEYDGDSVDSRIDTCPIQKNIWKTTFSLKNIVQLNSNSSGYLPLNWRIVTTVHPIGQHLQITKPDGEIIMLTNEKYAGFDLTATIYFQSDVPGGDIGFVFNYQTKEKFYIAKINNVESGQRGSVSIEERYMERIYNEDIAQRRLSWESKQNYTWQAEKPYMITIQSRPMSGTIRFYAQNNPSSKIFDSGFIKSIKLRGGRVGVYVRDRGGIIWSNIQVVCNEKEPLRIRHMEWFPSRIP